MDILIPLITARKFGKLLYCFWFQVMNCFALIQGTCIFLSLANPKKKKKMKDLIGSILCNKNIQVSAEASTLDLLFS